MAYRIWDIDSLTHKELRYKFSDSKLPERDHKAIVIKSLHENDMLITKLNDFDTFTKVYGRIPERSLLVLLDSLGEKAEIKDYMTSLPDTSLSGELDKCYAKELVNRIWDGKIPLDVAIEKTTSKDIFFGSLINKELISREGKFGSATELINLAEQYVKNFTPNSKTILLYGTDKERDMVDFVHARPLVLFNYLSSNKCNHVHDAIRYLLLIEVSLEDIIISVDDLCNRMGTVSAMGLLSFLILLDYADAGEIYSKLRSKILRKHVAEYLSQI